MTKLELFDHLNKMRLIHKGQWLFYTGECEGHTIKYKSYNTWVQLLEIDNGLRYTNLMDQKVSEWKRFLINTLNEVIK